jgi:carbon-monoxide dehydrogenase iron sulfur subunit
MPKILVTDPDKCRGCELCAIYCSVSHFKTHQPSRATIFVHSNKSSSIPLICTQCGLCLAACPMNALRRDVTTGAIYVADSCNGCGRCVMACPYGVVNIDPVTNKAIKCDYCNGEPQCVQHCPYGALKYLDHGAALEVRRFQTAESTMRRK